MDVSFIGHGTETDGGGMAGVAVRDQPGDQVTRNNSTMMKINKVLGLGLGGNGMGWDEVEITWNVSVIEIKND